MLFSRVRGKKRPPSVYPKRFQRSDPKAAAAAFSGSAPPPPPPLRSLVLRRRRCVLWFCAAAAAFSSSAPPPLRSLVLRRYRVIAAAASCQTIVYPACCFIWGELAARGVTIVIFRSLRVFWVRFDAADVGSYGNNCQAG